MLIRRFSCVINFNPMHGYDNFRLVVLIFWPSPASRWRVTSDKLGPLWSCFPSFNCWEMFICLLSSQPSFNKISSRDIINVLSNIDYNKNNFPLKNSAKRKKWHLNRIINLSPVKYSLFFVSPYLPDLALPQSSPALGPLKGFLKTFGNINKLPSYSVT